MKTVVVMGATPKEDRFAFKAMQRLEAHGCLAVPVNPAFQEVIGKKCHPSIGDVPGEIDTVTMYLGEARSTPLIAEIVAAKPRRIFFNPGSENEKLSVAAREAGIEVEHGCTLVSLEAGKF